MSQEELLNKKLERALKARKEAENILEQKALELFKANLNLRSLNESLEGQVQIRTQELEKSKIIAEQAQAAEASFLANMSHEIRTPLNAIVGMTHLLKDTPLNEEQSKLLTVLEDSSKILLSLISDILDLSKIDSGNIDVQSNEIDLKSIINTIINGLKNKAEQKKISINFQFDKQLNTVLISDELLLNQILFNLIGNAIKFTEEGKIDIIVNQIDQAENKKHISFSIIDTGIGIKKEDLELIFEQFKQVSSQIKHKYSGTGLGLSIIQKLIQLLDGKVNVSSEFGKGSNFNFKLWMDDSGKPILPLKPIQKENIDFSNFEQTILIAEDNPINQLYITKLLNKWNLKHDVAEDGQIAFDLVKENNYSMVFMDLQMPTMDGFEATKKIRSLDGPKSEIPIVALTASTLLTKKQKALSIGMNEFLSKPFVPKDLLKTIQKYLKIDVDIEDVKPKKEFSQNTLDDDYLESIYGDDKEYMHDIFEIFLNTIDPSLEAIKKGFTLKDFTSMKAEVHKLKPSFAMVGLPRLTDQMQELENLADPENDPKLIGSLLKKILESYATKANVIKSKYDSLKTK